jgi:hypothetical protein
LSPTAVRELLKAEGFAALPRRLDEERPQQPRATIEAVADVHSFSLAPRKFFTRCGGLFLFLPELIGLHPEKMAEAAGLPGSKMIPCAHALRACLALKLWSIERKSHVMSLVSDEGLALFSGLNVTPKKSYLSEYSCRITPPQTERLLAAWHHQLTGSKLLDGSSFNLDFHSMPYYGDDSVVEKHYVSMRSRRQKKFRPKNSSSLRGAPRERVRECQPRRCCKRRSAGRLACTRVVRDCGATLDRRPPGLLRRLSIRSRCRPGGLRSARARQSRSEL